MDMFRRYTNIVGNLALLITELLAVDDSLATDRDHWFLMAINDVFCYSVRALHSFAGSLVAQWFGHLRLIDSHGVKCQGKNLVVFGSADFSVDVDAAVSGPFTAANKCHVRHMKYPLCTDLGILS